MMGTKLIEDIWEDSPKSVEELEKLPLHSILLALGGYISIGIGTLHFLLSILEQFEYSRVFYFIINIIFGFALLLYYHMITSDTRKWAILASIFSLILISIGGIVGALAGLVGLSGSILAILVTFDESFDI